jgi:hypothetical protein
MASTAAKLDWMKKHLSYELLMLRATCNEMLVLVQQQANPKVQFEYNMAYESFAVHARNLKDFLGNDGGNNDFNAKEFVDGFKTEKREITASMFALHMQVFHMGKDRVANGAGKFNLEGCLRVYEWLEDQFERFAASLPNPFRDAWLELKGVGVRIGTVAVSQMSPSSSSSPTIVPLSTVKQAEDSQGGATYTIVTSGNAG